MTHMKFSSWPSYSKEEIDAVSNVLRSNKVNYWTGNQGRLFEKEFSKFTGSDHAIALANGTVALDVALKAINIRPGDEVIVTSRTFLASVSSIINAGAKPVFADVCLETQNISADTVAVMITSRTRAVVCVHLAGMPCDMDPLIELSNKHNLFVIEDCAQAHGATYKGSSIGSIGHIGCWSFCQDKIMTTGGEGGMVTTSSKELWTKMWSYKDHGKSWEAVYENNHPPGFRWVHESFGTNWRMTEMQAAIGRIQLGKMASWQSKRFSNAMQIWEAAESCSALRVPKITPDVMHAAYKCYVFVRGDQDQRDWWLSEINRAGVPCLSGSCSEVYLEKAFDNTNLRPLKRLSNAKKLGETSLMFLCHPTLTQDEIDLTCKVIKEVCN